MEVSILTSFVDFETYTKTAKEEGKEKKKVHVRSDKSLEKYYLSHNNLTIF